MTTTTKNVGRRSPRVSVSLTPATYAGLTAQAAAYDRPISWLVARIVADWLGPRAAEDGPLRPTEGP
jgi:hypothetical protein